MIAPPKLEKGDVIGITAPARSIAFEDMQLFVQKMESWGLKVKTGKRLFGSYHQFSGKDEDRAADLQEMIDDPRIKSVVFARGGYGSFRTLQHVDFSSLERNPKWIAGFSDITVFHSYLNKFLGIETIHSMMPLNFDRDADEESMETLRKALFGEPLSYEFPTHPLNIPGIVEGELTGGNLSVIYSLNGTVVFPDLKKKVLFIEDVDEYLYHVDRMMMNLSMSGAFNRAQAVVTGGFTKMRDNEVPFGKTAEEIIAGTVRKHHIPLCFNFPAGHQVINKTLIFGRKVQLRIEEGKSSLQFNP